MPAVAAGIAAYEGGAFKSLELSTVVSRFSWRGTDKPPKDLVVVGINADTQDRLNTRWPFPRSYHARVIDRLKADGAKMVAVDIALSQPSGRKPRYCGFAGAALPPDDCALLNSSAQAGNLGRLVAVQATMQQPQDQHLAADVFLRVRIALVVDDVLLLLGQVNAKPGHRQSLKWTQRSRDDSSVVFLLTGNDNVSLRPALSINGLR